jgi:hypothetical protein
MIKAGETGFGSGVIVLVGLSVAEGGGGVSVLEDVADGGIG